MKNNIVEVRNVEKRFKTYDVKGSGFFASMFGRRYYVKRALKGVSFSIKEGDSVALLGKNGSGKSTIIKIMTGILYPDAGTVRVFGMDPWEMRKKVATNIGVVMGIHGQLYTDLPAIDTFGLMKSIYNIPDRQFNERLEYLLEVLELEKVYKRQVRTLSLGEQMKCNFVASLLHNPKIVFLDEPTIGVDLSSKASLRNAIDGIRKNNNTTFLLTTHMTEDIDVAERVIMLNEGKVIFDNSREKLLKLFGDKRVIEFYFRNQVKRDAYSKFGKVLKYEPTYMKMEVEGKTLKENSFIKMLYDPNVIDYSVEQPNIGDVILKLYKGKRR